MSPGERRFVEDRETRQAAWSVVESGVAQVRADLDARSIPGRIADQAKDEVTEAVATGMEIASESKGIIAAVLGLSALWLFRAPLLSAVAGLISDPDPAEVNDPPDRDKVTGSEEISQSE
ncbi:MAG: hypothetical protein JSR96_11265 [Proteobacteria bacterium]|nr:hypothetical protein [Pseudomonadota bacterium]